MRFNNQPEEENDEVLKLNQIKGIFGFPYFIHKKAEPVAQLAYEYFREKEKKERKICSGPLTSLGILPATEEEKEKCEESSKILYEKYYEIVSSKGLSVSVFSLFISSHGYDVLCRCGYVHPLIEN